MRLLFTLFFISFALALPKLSREERKALADEADKQIDFINPTDLEVSMKSGTWFLFFGANWCKFTQLFTPKYLQVQQKVKETGLFEGLPLQMRKVECSTNAEYCSSKHGVNEYPTILMYVDGVKIEEYLNEDSYEAFYAYLVEKANAYNHEKKDSAYQQPARITSKNQFKSEAKMEAGQSAEVLFIDRDHQMLMLSRNSPMKVVSRGSG